MVNTKAKRFNIKHMAIWAQENLFNTKLNSALTVIMAGVAVAFAYFIINYVFFSANWGIVTENQRLLVLGSYPEGESIRILLPLGLGMAVLGLVFGIWSNKRLYAIILGSVSVILLLLGFDFIPSWLNDLSLGLAIPFESTTINPETGLEEQGISSAWWSTALILLGSYTASWIPWIPFYKGRTLRSYSANPIVLQSVLLAVVLVVLMTILLQQGVFPTQWGGVFVDIMVFSVGGCIIMMPLGLLLALARNSRFVVLKYATTVYIEIIRAGPLVVWLIFAFFLWNDFLGDSLTPDFPIRAMLVFGFFGAAYIAEVIRGGLQSIPKGQYEAAFSINLSTFQTYTIIILPQAIRAVVPAIIGRFISIWKDTSLLTALGVTNLLNAGQAVLSLDFANVEFLIEVFLAIAVIYWLVSFALSRFGRYTEKKLNL